MFKFKDRISNLAKLRGEILESRETPAVCQWTYLGLGLGDSSYLGNWFAGEVPVAGDTIYIPKSTSGMDLKLGSLGDLIIESGWGKEIKRDGNLTITGEAQFRSGTLTLDGSLMLGRSFFGHIADEDDPSPDERFSLFTSDHTVSSMSNSYGKVLELNGLITDFSIMNYGDAEVNRNVVINNDGASLTNYGNFKINEIVTIKHDLYVTVPETGFNSFMNYGTMTIVSGKTLDTDVALSNFGTFNLQSNSTFSTSAYVERTAADLTGTTTDKVSILNTGTMNLSDGVNIEVSKSKVYVQGGTIKLDAGAKANVKNGDVKFEGGTLEFTSGGANSSKGKFSVKDTTYGSVYFYRNSTVRLAADLTASRSDMIDCQAVQFDSTNTISFTFINVPMTVPNTQIGFITYGILHVGDFNNYYMAMLPPMTHGVNTTTHQYYIVPTSPPPMSPPPMPPMTSISPPPFPPIVSPLPPLIP